MERFEPQAPGTVLVRGHYPLRLLAVVHDLDREPAWRREWVRLALQGILAQVTGGGLCTLALPPLGIRHGRMAPAGFFPLLFKALARARRQASLGIWLPMADANACQALLDAPGR